jgi:glutathione synthase/RimK-type ligase-like ATP-grasp enzyme
MTIIIVAPENDNHTAPLKWALEQADYRVACWAGLGWSAGRQASISFSDEAQLTLGSHTLAPGDVVWVRRPEQATPNPKVADADKKFAEAEYRWFSQSLMYFLDVLPIRCINKYSASRLINNKSIQLLVARSCGMNVPHTLMSNCPSKVRDYFQQNTGRMICKAFFPHIWQKEGNKSVAITETFEMSKNMLPAEEVLTYAPAIYQDMVVKQFDVRMVLLGAAVYSCALYNPKGAIDWRQDTSQGVVQVEKMETPAAVERAVLAFAEKSGISFGSFDFAVDSEGRWWFLEVNEGGQFLWLDASNHDVHIQEKFLAFVTSPEGSSRQTIEERQWLFPSWKDYLDSAAKDQQTPEERHAEPAFVSIEP